jgi:uncharacterized protein (DUF2141 family)
MKKKGIDVIATIIILATFIAGCAKISSPTGGPRDTTPPKVVKMSPEDQTVRFHDKQIRIFFDEYVTLNNPTTNVLISPPMAEPPQYTLNGKSLIIKFKDTLRANTTYNMVFSDCIRDYHENTPLNYFHYSFSTGDSLDDYMIQGTILDAKSLAPAKDFYVLLYKNTADSLPLTTRPDFVTKTQDNGSFSFQNISEGDYKIFALKDINSDLLYNLPNEEIAFLEETVTAYHALSDSASDSLKATLPMLKMYSFMGVDTSQKLQHNENPAAGIYVFPYKSAVNHFSAIPTDKTLDYFERINETKDTITWYLKSPLSDTVMYLLDADNHIDTVRLAPYHEKQATGRNRIAPSKKLNVTFLNAGEYHKPLTLKFSYPIRPIDSFDVYVYSQHQSIKDTAIYRYFVPDSFVMQLPLPMDYQEKKSYTVMIPDSVFYGYNGLTNDTLKMQFSAKSVKEYGTLIMSYELPDDGKTYFVTLWKGDKKIQEDRLTESSTITYSFLNPDSYRISAFCDENGNGKWDTGDYTSKRQPEKMFSFPKSISIRAYWDLEETFKIGSNN